MNRSVLAVVMALASAPSFAQFTIPSLAQAAFGDQAEVDPIDIAILVAGHGGTGVISGVAVTAQGSPDMTLAVASGTVRVGTTIAAVSSGNVTITTAHATLPRFDLVVANNAGTKSVTAGTASTNPVFPSIPADSVVFAAVYVPAADTAIQSNQITDKRVILGFSGQLTTLTAGRIPFVGAGGLLTDDADLTFATDRVTVTKITAPGEITAPGGANSEKFGSGATASGSSSVAVGFGATSGSTTESTAVGTSADASSANQATAVGKSALASGASSVAVGRNATASGTSSTAVGAGASANSSTCTALGASASCNSVSDVIVLGSTISTTVYLGGSVFGAGGTQTFSGKEANSAASNAVSDSAEVRPGRSTGTGTAGNVYLSRVPTVQGSGSSYNAAVQGVTVVSKARTLTDATATTLFQVGGLGAHRRAGGTVLFNVQAGDGTNDQEAGGSLRWSCVDTTAGAGGETCNAAVVGTVDATGANGGAASSGTLSCTAAATTGTDVGNIQLNCDSSLTTTVLNVYYTPVTNCETCTITPQ